MSSIIEHGLLYNSESEDELESMVYPIPGVYFPSTVISSHSFRDRYEIITEQTKKSEIKGDRERLDADAASWSLCGSLCVLGCWFGVCIVPLVSNTLQMTYKFCGDCDNTTKPHAI